MAFERYYVQVAAHAEKLGIKNEPGANGKPSLDEDALTVHSIRFFDEKGRCMTTVEMTEMNKGGRLFFEQYARKGVDRLVLFSEPLRADMADYFQELWEEALNPERVLMSALRTYEYAELVYKK